MSVLPTGPRPPASLGSVSFTFGLADPASPAGAEDSEEGDAYISLGLSWEREEALPRPTGSLPFTGSFIGTGHIPFTRTIKGRGP